MSQEPPGFPPEPPDPGSSFPPPLPSGLPGAPSRGIPWERRDEIGLVAALIETTKQVLTGPTDFFQRMPVAGGLGSPLLYAVIIGYLGILVSAVYSSVFMLVGGAARGAFGAFGDRPEIARMVEAFSGWGGIIGQVLFGPFGIVIALFVSTAITHVMLMLLDGAGQGFEATFRVRGYASAATVLAIVPFCGGAIGAIWSLVLCIIGLAEAQRIPVWKAALAVLLPIVLCCCCCAAGVGMFFGSIASMLSQQR
jgi:hypothetical protein